jgi:hypothetical protein
MVLKKGNDALLARVEQVLDPTRSRRDIALILK